MKIVPVLNRFDKILWLGSLLLLILCYVCSPEKNPLTLAATLIGATSLIFLAKGHVTGQFFTIVFSLLYGVISFQFRYYGEMITYLGMTAPSALFAAISWLRHPYQDKAEVQVAAMSRMKWAVLLGAATGITILFYFLLDFFHTANLVMSTVSVFTSFLASGLMFLRSPFYAVAYSVNDIVLIILWVLASLENPGYIPMILCFVIFFVNDIYGFVSWRQMQRRQA